ncbi:MAG TPA: MEKHLA domain-containing protein [Paraburkholderia sp.]|jgi:PAS domain-containing protein|nr:MEKHLA domain-containing protein [Paraburkholderia sp.]
MTSPVDQEFFKLVSMSYWRLLGEHLVSPEIAAEEAAAWLYYRAPFGLLAHNTEPDPVFVYGNRRAQELFEYSWDELTVLPSRLSAQAPDQNERQAFLEQVKRHGFVSAYRGVRVAKSGKRFWIENALVWQLHDETGKYYGQAALIPESSAA